MSFMHLRAALFGAVALFLATAVAAQTQVLQKQLGTGQPTTVNVGGQVIYVIRGSCNSLTGDCGTLTISDTLPPELEVVSCSAAGSFFSAPNGSLTCTAGAGTFSAVRNVFADGASYTLTVTTRARLSLTASASNVVNTVNAGILGQVCPAASPNCSVASAPPININGPTPQYRTRKVRIDPAKPEASNNNPTASLQIAAGTDVRYRVQFCSTAATGNLALSNVTLTDTFAVVAPATTVVNAGGGTVAANTIAWTLTSTELSGLLGTTNCVNREFVLRYGALALGTIVDNSVTATGSNVNGGGLGPGPLTSTVLDQIGGPTPGAAIGKSGNDATPPGTVTWRLDMNNTNSNVPLNDFVVIDELPRLPASTSGPLQITSFRTGAWPNGNALDYNVVADIYTTTLAAPGACDGANVNWIAEAIGVTAAANTQFNAPADFPSNISAICWRFRNTNAANPLNQIPRGFSFTTQPQIVQSVPNGTPLGIVQNCVSANWSGPGAAGSAGPTCRNQNIEVPLPAINASKTRINPNTGNLEPLQDFAYRLSFNHVGADSTGNIVNPTVVDLLPANVEFLGWTAYNGPAGKPAPNLTIVPNFLPGRTLLRFTWSAAAPVGSVQLNGTPGVANAANFEPTIADNQMPRIDISVRIRAGTAPGNGGSDPLYRNSLNVTENGLTGYTCSSGQSTVDTNDLDGDGNTTENHCVTTANFTVVQAAVLEGEKWIRGDFAALPNVDDPTDGTPPPGGVCPDYVTNYPSSTVGTGYTRFPCVARTDHGNAFDYVVRVSNGGNQNLDAYVLYDVLPFVGDTGSGQPLATSPRNTSWRPVMTGPISVVSSAGTPGFVIEYSTAAPGTMCRPEVSNGAGSFQYDRGDLPLPTTFWQPGCNNTFTASPADFSQVTGFRVRAYNSSNFPVLGTFELRVPMRAPTTGAPPSVIANPAIFFPAWNSFAHTAFVAGSGATALPLPTAEPRKVGIIVPERYRLGNLVWNDLDNDGIAENGEPGINGVQVRLCRDTDGTSGPSGGDTVVGNATTATLGGQAGKYSFDTLVGGSNYYLAVLDGQTVLRGYLSSTTNEADPNNDGDNNDNGASGSGVCGNATGIASGAITLGVSGATEPSNEVLRAGSGTRDDTTPTSFPLPGNGFGDYPDQLSNHSVDYGFFLVTDLGDLPDGAAAIGAGNYRTLLRTSGDQGAAHVIAPGLRLGACVDSELDGQPGTNANGDDTGASVSTQGACAVANDDEDGITVADLTMTTGQAATVRAVVTNTSGAGGRLCGFADLNADGDFADANENAFVDVPNGTSNGNVTLNFGTLASSPATYNLTPPSQSRYFRFRLNNNQNACAADNDAAIPDGEVEDYLGALVVPIDRGDLPDPAAGVGVGNYETSIASGGPGHPLRPDLRIGACVDADTDGQPNVNANGDDLGAGSNVQGVCAVANDDEDGLAAVPSYLAGAPTSTPVTVFNNTGAAAQLCAFIDWNRDGDFLDTVDGAIETQTLSVPSSATPGTATINFGTAPVSVGTGVNYLRLRLSSDGSACSANGLASDGEVEDYRIAFEARDFGDLPDTGPGIGVGNYSTLSADSGASHGIVPGVFLGAGVDAEGNGQPNTNANGDDLNSDDEDGVTFPGVDPVFAGRLVAGRSNPVQIVASVAGRLNCFFDFNGNGSLTDGAEYAFNEQAVAAGTNSLTLPVPIAAANTSVYFRCRFSDQSADGNTAIGPAARGEVEDGVVPVVAADLGDLPDPAAASAANDYRTRIADNGAAHGIVAGLRMGACVDGEADGQPGAAATGDDLGAGVATQGACAVANDDEDGVTVADLALISTAPATIRVSVSNSTGASANLCGFVDWNGDGDFADTVGGTPESASQSVATGASNTTVTLNFGTAPVTTTTASYARFRLQEGTTPCSEAGAAASGEVEDYPVTITPPDYGDLPDTGAGIGPGNYRTTFADGGPLHPLRAGLRLGACVDSEANGVPGATALGDDTAVGITTQGSCAAANDDEDGLSAAALTIVGNLIAGGANTVPVLATNTTGSAARLCGFIDFNGDGDFADASETQSAPVATGSNNVPINLTFSPPLAAQAGNRYARFRLSTDTAGNCSADGPASDGEVEDYVVAIRLPDFGDLPDTAVGSGNGNYVTLLADARVAHDITTTASTLFLGASVDAEADGQPNALANGDDLALNPDDEDGLNPADQVQVQGLPATFRFTATNTTGSLANLCGYVDWNADGDFADASETASLVVPSPSSSVNVTVNFGTVPNGSSGQRYARFRYSNAVCGQQLPTGDAPGVFPNGEVEDYVIDDRVADRGDLPDTSAGSGVGNYSTTLADGGPSHGLVNGLRIGACVDSEVDGQPTAAANGDDTGAGTSTLGSCATANDDEDGINVADLGFISTLPANVRAVVTNTAGGAATLCGFVDWNGDGDFADTVGGISEQAQVAVPNGSNGTTVALAFGNAPIAPVGSSYARFRLSTVAGCSPNAPAVDGEVEDYPITITRRDFGDLPDTAVGTGVGNYQTLLNDNGAAHDIVDGLFMGALVDPEGDGQPNVAANGDDIAASPDDEDGVNTSDLANFHLGSPANLRIVATNTTGTAAQACGFVDWNRDGDFADTRETASIAVPTGSNNAMFTLAFGAVPSFGPLGQTYARVRLQNASTPCAVGGLVNAGEVEDYVATVLPGEMSLGNLVWQDRDNSGTFNTGDTPFPGIPVVLFRDADDNGTPDGPAIGTQPTNGTGNYLFTELVPDTYLVCITAPNEWVSSTGTGRRYAPIGSTEPAVDPDNDANNDDNGTAGTPVTQICARGTTLVFGQEPTNDGDADNNSNLSVDFGLLYNFDLALRKTLSPGQPFEVNFGETVNYTISVFNQGTVSARNIVVTDWVPPGMQLNDTAWTAAAGNTVTRTIAGPLAPGANAQVTLALRILNSATPGNLRNVAEISSAQDGNGVPIPDFLDRDSDPDGSLGDPEVDNEIDNNGGDEDDADPESINLGFGLIGVAKQLLDISVNTGSYGQGSLAGTGNVSLRFTLRNYGNRNVSALDLIDNLGAVIPGATFTIQSLTATGGLTANAGFNGTSVTSLLGSNQSLAAGASATVTLNFLVRGINNTNAAIFNNSATLRGIAPGDIALTDVSVNGANPDANNNNDPTDDTSPTPIDLRGLAQATPIPVLGPYGGLLLIGMLLLLARRRLQRG